MNFFMHGKNRGNNKKLLGNILIVCIYIDDSESSWNDSDKKFLREKVNQSILILKRNALIYQIELNIQTKFYNSKTSIKTHFQNNDFSKSIHNHKKEYYKWINNLKKEYQVNEVILMFCVNKPGISYAQMNTFHSPFVFEYCMIFIKKINHIEYTIIHELLHLYGAEDLYVIEDAKKIAEIYFPKSIMLSTINDQIDELSAYLIGWCDFPHPKASQFLYKTRSINYRQYAKEYKNLFKDK